MKTVIICNPVAGDGRNREALAHKLGEALRAQVRLTKKKGEATRLARNAMINGFDYIIAAGGDGTLNEVINGVAENAPFELFSLYQMPVDGLTSVDGARSVP